MSQLSPRQTGLLVHIAVYISQRGYAPSVRDLSDAMGGISTNAVANHIAACVKKGYLSKASGIARSLTLTEKGRQLIASDAIPKADSQPKAG